jgi:nucleotide-binding universal stress UspA family protein
MLKNILIGLDGSDYCHEAINYAIDLSKNFGAKLFGLGIIDAPAIFDPSPAIRGRQRKGKRLPPLLPGQVQQGECELRNQPQRGVPR